MTTLYEEYVNLTKRLKKPRDVTIDRYKKLVLEKYEQFDIIIGYEKQSLERR